MTNYLKETYGGSKINMLSNSAYFCYTIKDVETEKYYSGSRGVEGSNEHDLLVNYCTSSSVTDFRKKIKEYPEKFEFIIEYFPTRADAFNAEREYHKKHNVGKSKYFLNSISSGGTNCGAGSVLCRGENGKTYRVSVDEYSTGKHVHVSKNMMNIRTPDGIKKIPVNKFDPTKHTTEFKNYVLALDTVTGKSCRIPNEKFIGNNRYIGITSGLVVAYDTQLDTRVSIPVEEFRNSKGRYVGNTHGMVPVIDKTTGETVIINKEEYDKEKYKHHNTDSLVVYSLGEKKNVRITRDEYNKNKEKYTNTNTKVFYIVDDIFFKSKKDLDVYYRQTRGKTVLKVSQSSMHIKFNDIKTITKEEYEN